MSKNFVHLHLHTAYSMLDGACRVEDVMNGANEMNMPAVAITDHGVMYGAVDFYKSAVKAGIKPIIGCETYVAPGSHKDRKAEGGRAGINHLVLLATSNVGYTNLVKLISTAHLDGFYYKPRIDKELLAQYSKGLIGMSACLKGEVASYLVDGNFDEAVRAAGEYADILGKDNFFLELQDHSLPEQKDVNKQMVKVSAKTKIPLVATNDVHYLKKEHAEAHELMLCIQTQTVMSDPTRMCYHTNEFYMKSRAEMEHLFKELPDSLDITLRIAERCNVELEFGKLHFPIYKLPEGTTQKQYFRKICHEGMKHHYGIKDPEKPKDTAEKEIVARFEYETGIIEKTGFINYYLVVWDFIKFAKDHNIPVGPGRGSGGGSMAAYLMGITSIDPLRYGLIFERFLNPERVSPPDFDIDFCQSRRGEVIEYVKQKYGRDNVAQIITFGSLGAKMVVRDLGRVLEVPFADCDKLAKMIPGKPDTTLESALKDSPEFKDAYDSNKEYRKIIDHGMVIEGLYRNAGTHAAGVVIGEKPLIEIVPLARDKDKEIITQYSMEPLGEIGLLKMDFLGLKTLTVINEALELIKQYRNVVIDLEKIPYEDKPTYDLLSRGDTVGVFQLESPGMRELIRKVQINRIEDLIAMIALYRPGPMEGGMIDDYVNRKHGKAKLTYPHPLLEPILKETHGVIVYQEQVQKVANVLAGYSLGQADLLRRAMGKKKKEAMALERDKFVAGCKNTTHIKEELAGTIFDLMEKFAGYGFNKSHSAGYGIISYQTAYLKANYPEEFMSALLSCEIGNTEKLTVFISETEDMGLNVQAPDVNISETRFKPAKNSVIFGLAGIKNVGEGISQEIRTERQKNGPYKSLVDFCSRLGSHGANKKIIESLVRCGAFSSIDNNRAKLFNGIDFAMKRSEENRIGKATGQGSLFGEMFKSDDLPDCPAMHESEMLTAEKELLGMYMSGHPLKKFAKLISRYHLASVTQLIEQREQNEGREHVYTTIGGIISSIQKRVTKETQKTWATALLEDLDGSIELTVYNKTYDQYSDLLTPERAVLVQGEVNYKDSKPKIVARDIYPIEKTSELLTAQMHIHITEAQARDEELFSSVDRIIKSNNGPIPLGIWLILDDGTKLLMDTGREFKVTATDKFTQEIEHVLGEKSVYVTTKSISPSREKPRWQDFKK